MLLPAKLTRVVCVSSADIQPIILQVKSRPSVDNTVTVQSWVSIKFLTLNALIYLGFTKQ